MMKLLLGVLAALALSACAGFSRPSHPSASAEEARLPSGALEFEMPCQLEGGVRLGAPRVSVLKRPNKQSTGKWRNDYFIRVTPLNPTVKPVDVPLAPAGSGDEDYDEYHAARNAFRLGYATIQRQFKWASISSEDGRPFAACKPATNQP